MDFAGDLEKCDFSGSMKENPEHSAFKKERDLREVETSENKKCFWGILPSKKMGSLEEDRDQGMVSQ